MKKKKERPTDKALKVKRKAFVLEKVEVINLQNQDVFYSKLASEDSLSTDIVKKSFIFP